MGSATFIPLSQSFSQSFIKRLSGPISATSVVHTGTGYSNTDTITFTRNPADSVITGNATASVTTDASGGLISVNIIKGGLYSYPPTVTITSSLGTGGTVNTIVDCDNYYMLLTGTSAYNAEPTPDPIDTSYTGSRTKPYSQAVFGIKLSVNSFSSMIESQHWTANTIYSQYDDMDKMLQTEPFYCVTSSGAVFKCIQNGGNTPSTVQPANTTPTSFPEIESDGYQWFYMYNVDTAPPFSTIYSDWVPVHTDSNVSAATTYGSIMNVVVINAGSGYPSSFGTVVANTADSKSILLSGVPSIVPNYYAGCTLTVWNGSTPTNFVVNTSTTSSDGKLQVALTSSYTANLGIVYQLAPSIQINGNGTGFVGHAIIVGNNQVLSKVVVTNPGTNYTYANANIVSIAGFGTGANIRAVISPGAGHGSDAEVELFSHNIGTVSVLTTSDPNMSTNAINASITYRTLAIVKNPMAYSNLTIGSNTLYTSQSLNQRVALTLIGSAAFVLGETVTLSSSLNMVVAAANVTAHMIEVTGLTTVPSVGDILTGLESGTISTINTIGIGGNELSPDIQFNSGDVVYLNNIAPTIYSGNTLSPVIRVVINP